MLKQILTSGSILALLLGGSITAEATIKQPLFLSQTENTPSNPPASDNSSPRGPNDANPPIAPDRPNSSPDRPNSSPDRPNSSPDRPNSSPDNSTSPVSPGVNDQKAPDRRPPSPDNSTSPGSPGSNDPTTPPAPIPVSPGGNDPANSPSTPPPNSGNGDPTSPSKPAKTTSEASSASCDVEARRPTGGSSRMRNQMLDDCSQSR